MKIYLSGPMSGIENYNYPEFDKYAGYLREQGHLVHNPADFKRSTKVDDRRQLLCNDVNVICLWADAVFLLEGWHKSTGAKAEAALALAIGLEVHRIGLNYYEKIHSYKAESTQIESLVDNDG